MFLPSLHFKACGNSQTIEIATRNESGDVSPKALLRVKGLTPKMADCITDALGMAYQLGAQNMAIALDRPDVRIVSENDMNDPSERILMELLKAIIGKQSA